METVIIKTFENFLGPRGIPNHIFFNLWVREYPNSSTSFFSTNFNLESARIERSAKNKIKLTKHFKY